MLLRHVSMLRYRPTVLRESWTSRPCWEAAMGTGVRSCCRAIHRRSPGNAGKSHTKHLIMRTCEASAFDAADLVAESIA